LEKKQNATINVIFKGDSMSKKDADEITLTINLRKAYNAPRKKRANVAIRLLHTFIQRHFHVTYVRIDEKLNKYLWSRGAEKPPRKVTIKVNKVEEDLAEVSLA